MKLNRRLFLGGTASAAVLAALAACGSSDGSKGASGKASPTELAASDINPQDVSKLKDGGEFHMTIDQWIPQYNPFHIDGNIADNSTTLWSFAGPNNWIYGEDGTPKANPDFVKDFKEEVKDGKTVATIHLNPKAVWNDGTPITVADFQASWKACNGENADFNEMIVTSDGWNQIESIEKGADDYEAIITHKAIYPDWTATFSVTVSAKLTGDPEAFKGWTDASVTDYWSGPFIITSADKAKQTYTLERNPKWWGEKAKLDKVTLQVVSADQLGTAFGNGEVDYVAPIIDAATYKQCQARKDGEIRQSAGTQWRHFTMNTSTGLLADEKLRQAIVKGIDRETITEADLQGLPVPASQLQLGNHLFMPHNDGYKDNSTKYKFNKEQAIKDLEALGWTLPEGKEYREKDGQTLSIKYLRLPDVSTSATEGKILQANMKEIGVEIVMDDTNSDDFFPRIAKGNFEIVAFTWVGTAYPMNNIGQIYGTGSPSNYSKTSSKELDELITKVAQEADHAKRVELANQADALIWDQCAVIPIYSRVDYRAVPTALANFGSLGLSSVPAQNIGLVAG